MTHAEFRKMVVACTGQNVEQIELTVAENCYWTHHGEPADAWEDARYFVEEMKKFYEKHHNTLTNTTSGAESENESSPPAPTE